MTLIGLFCTLLEIYELEQFYLWNILLKGGPKLMRPEHMQTIRVAEKFLRVVIAIF